MTDYSLNKYTTRHHNRQAHKHAHRQRVREQQEQRHSERDAQQWHPRQPDPAQVAQDALRRLESLPDGLEGSFAGPHATMLTGGPYHSWWIEPAYHEVHKYDPPPQETDVLPFYCPICKLHRRMPVGQAADENTVRQDTLCKFMSSIPCPPNAHGGMREAG